MKIAFFRSKTRLPYILFTFLTVFIFLLACPPYNRLTEKIGGIVLFIVLFIIALVHSFNYKKWLLGASEEKIKEYVHRGMLIERRNSGLEGALETSEELFSVAQDEILIKAGNADHEFYEDETICGALEKFLEKGCKIRMICSPKEKCDSKTRTIFEFQNNPSYNIKILHAQVRPELHFMVVDDRHYRLEKKHPPKKHYAANIIYNNHFAADFHRYLFLKEWDELAGDGNSR